MGEVVRPIPFDDMLLLVGKLNYTWTNTESLLVHLIAGLSGIDKETAVVIFLTLNTTRARVDLVERLAKMERRSSFERKQILEVTGRLMRLASLRNRYNHCIYAFDPESGNIRTILMRIADRKNDIKIGETTHIDAAAVDDISDSIRRLTELNSEIWSTIHAFDYPA